MKSLYVGKKRALVFPVMCDGYLRIDYSDQIAGQAHGIFGYDDSFTIEAIITPYDLNGSGYKVTSVDNPAGESGVVDSVKTFPNVQSYNVTATQFQDYKYSTDEIRMVSAMSLFHSTSVKLELLNSTTTTHNQPAEYKIRFSVYANGLDTLTSDVVISPRVLSTGTTSFTQVESGSTVQHSYGFKSDEIRYHEISAPIISHMDISDEFIVSGTGSHNYYVGQKLYRLLGTTFTSIGEVTAVLFSGITISETVTPSLAGATIYTDAYKEAHLCNLEQE